MSEQPQAPEVILDASDLPPAYVNTCHLSGTPEEIILDFGLNPAPSSAGRQELKASNRLVMNYFTAKRLWASLGMMVQRFEGTFGGIELDISRRVVSNRTQAPAAPSESALKTEPAPGSLTSWSS
jgi:Protein of unknown function (DUF3467)